jgi:SAM-dependent methyltransferase
MSHDNEAYSKEGRTWEASSGLWIGGYFPVDNQSRGYHGIEKQWWDVYASKSPKVLLVGEDEKAAVSFNAIYPEWKITTLDKYLEGEHTDLCSADLGIFDLILCQATLEHVHDPFGAMENMARSLNDNGILVVHTHAPEFPYHAFPVDCFRFMKDWWYSLPEYLPLDLLELFMVDNRHVFTCYRRV